MRHDDLEGPEFRRRYPNAQLVETTNKFRRRKYVIVETGRRLVVSVTSGASKANLIEFAAATALASSGLPAPRAIEIFEDRGRRYLVQQCVNGTPLEEILASANRETSFSLGKLVGELAGRMHSVPVSELKALPASDLPWWSWLQTLEPNLVVPSRLVAIEPTRAFVHNDFLPHNVLLDSQNGGIAAILDFEWSFVGDPVWDMAYLRYWLRTGPYAHAEHCLEGVMSGYSTPINEALADFYAGLREPETMAWWRGHVPPPVGWLNPIP